MDKVSLTGCNVQMYLEALVIAAQTAGLSYYLMQPQPFQNISFLIGSFALSQAQMFYNIIRATGGYRFEYFSKVLITQIMASILVCFLTYNLFSQINEVSQNTEDGSTLRPQSVETYEQN